MKTLAAILLVITNIFLDINVYAQNPHLREKVLDDNGEISLAKLDLDSSKYPSSEGARLLMEILNTQKEDRFTLISTKTDKYGYRHDKYQLFHKNLIVEGASFNLHSKDSYIESLNGKYFRKKSTIHKPNISQSEALKAALNVVNAKLYEWEVADSIKIADSIKKNSGVFSVKNFPEGNLVYRPNFNHPDKKCILTWKFQITALEPYSSEYIYISAIDKKLIDRVSLIYNANSPGNAETEYSYTVPIITDENGGAYYLKEVRNGVSIETRNGYTNGVYQNTSNNWTEGAIGTAMPLDVHWGIEKVIDYWIENHGYYSYNGDPNNPIPVVNKIYTEDTFGGRFSAGGFSDPVLEYSTFAGGNSTSLDVCAHEFGHGIEYFGGAGLENTREPGALNESFADIWMAVIEHWVIQQNLLNEYDIDKDPWLKGEEDLPFPLTPQSFRDPKSSESFPQPDTYEGELWEDPNCTFPSENDGCGIHTNSGVMNYWFYLLSEGNSTDNYENDCHNFYSISGIGIEKAAKIVHIAQTQYLASSTSKFLDARNAIILAAENLYGETSYEVKAVTNAWYAVGVGPAHPSSYPISGPYSTCSTGTYTVTDNQSNSNNNNYYWASSSEINIVSGQYTNSIYIETTPSGTQGWVEVVITNPCGDISSPIRKYISYEAPQFTYVATNTGTVSSTYETHYYCPSSNDCPNWITVDIDNQEHLGEQCVDWDYYPSESVLNTDYCTTSCFNTIGDPSFIQANLTISNDCGSNGLTIIFERDPSCPMTMSMSSMSVYPNPSSDAVIVEILNDNDNHVNQEQIESLVLYDNLGTKLKELKKKGKRIIFSTREFKEGNYILHIQVANKIIKQHISINR